MKKFLFSLLMVLMFVPTLVMAEGKEPVKVYIFEAGGCPACEAQTEYLESLESNNDKFKIVHKELYVDHNTWAQGKDYKLGTKVVNYCHSLGFTEAVTTSTPLVVISDVYCANSYNGNLEEVINQVYEEGDNDIVALFSNENDKPTINPVVLFGVMGAALVVIGAIVAVVVIKDKNESEKDVKKENNKLEKKEDKKEIVEEKTTKNEKKVESKQPKKTTNNSKKTTSAKTNKSTNNKKSTSTQTKKTNTKSKKN